MQRRDNEVSRFGGHESGFDRFEIAHFADNDYVRVLPENVPKGGLERPHVAEYFLLDDDAAAVLVRELDRVFDRDDFETSILVDGVDHVIERRRFTHPGGPGDENQTARKASQFVDNRRQAQFLRRANCRFTQADRELGAARVKIDADPEPTDARDLPREARLPFAFEQLLLVGIEHRFVECLQILGLQRADPRWAGSRR